MNKTSDNFSKIRKNRFSLLGILLLIICGIFVVLIIFTSNGSKVTQQDVFAGELLNSEQTGTPELTKTSTPTPDIYALATEVEECKDSEDLEKCLSEPIYIFFEIMEEDEKRIIRLPDGSEIILDSDAEIALTKIFGHTAGASYHEIILLRGKILVDSKLPEGEWFRVLNPDGFIAQVTGSKLIVDYDPVNRKFVAQCVEGDCELGPDEQELIELAAKTEGWLDENGEFDGPIEIDMDVIREEYGEKIPEETPDHEATATAVCEQHQSQNPGTPCPND